MKKSRVVVLLCVVCALAWAAPELAAGQLGGLLKKKIPDLVKPAEPQTPKTGPAPMMGSNLLAITDGLLDALATGLQAEIVLREAFVKEAATWKTPEQYAACTRQVTSSPESMKLAARLLDLPENTTPERMQALMAEIGKQLEALTLKVCGQNPRPFLESRGDRLAEIQRKGAAAASAAVK